MKSEFIHDPLETIELERVTREDGVRHYVTPEGNHYPSVTTMLSDDPNKQAGLDDWKAQIGEEEAERIVEEAANQGTIVHDIIEDYLQNKTPDFSKANPHHQMMFKKMKKELRRVDNIRAQEIPLYSDILRLAGTVDCFADFNGVPSIIDFKTSRKPKKKEWISDYFCQTTAYSIMIEELYGLTAEQLVVIMADNKSSQGYHFIEHRNNFKHELSKRIKDFRKRNRL